MTTYTLTTTLLGTGQTYSILNSGGLNVSVGDVLNLEVTAGFPATVSNLTDVRVSETGGAPPLGENKSSPHTFSYTIPIGTTSAARTEYLYFYGSRNQSGGYSSAHARIWGTSGVNGERRGFFQLNIAEYGCQADAPLGSVNVSIPSTITATPTVTISGASAATNGCTLRIRARQTSPSASTGAWQPSGQMTVAVTRGNTYVFEVGHHGSSGSPTIISSNSTFIPYSIADLDVSTNASNYTTTDGTFSFTVTNVDATGTNKYIIKESNGTVVYLLNGGLVSKPPGTYTILSDNPSNVPAGTTKTYRVWGKRSSSVGGGVGIARYLQTTASFTVTRAATNTFNEVVTETSGSYFDRNVYGAANRATHYLNITSAIATKYYNVSTSSTSVSSPLLSAWTVAGATSKTFTVTDTPAVPSGANGTTVTYYLWRSDASNGSTPAYTGRSYTRTLVVDDRFTFSSSSVVMPNNGSTSFSQTINNTIAGHTYKINRGGSTLLSVTATGTNTTVTVPESSIPNATNATVHTLYTQAPLNYPFAYSTGKTYTVTRAGTAPADSYGMEVFAANGVTKLYDTEIRTARLWAAGVAPASGGVSSGATETVNVTGLSASTDEFTIIIIPQNSTNSFTTNAFTVQQNAGNFVITNGSTITQVYQWLVIKSSGA